MIRNLALASTAVLTFCAAAYGEEGGALPMRHGIYVESGTDCAAANNANSISFWGDRLNSAHVIGNIRDVVGGDGVFAVTLDLEGDGGMGGGLRERAEWQVITDEGGALLIESDTGATLYRWCAASMADLDQMQRQQPETSPITSVGYPAWVSMRELSTDMNPPDSNVVWIWQDVLQAEAESVRSGDGEIFVRGQRTTLPDNGFRPSDFLWVEFKGENADYIVSIMGQQPPACDAGANSATSTSVHSVCPARLTTIPKDGSDTTTVEMPGACAIWPSFLVEPEEGTGTFAKLSGDVISLEAVQDGEPILGCNITFSLGRATTADEHGGEDNVRPGTTLPQPAPLSLPDDSPAFMGIWGYAFAPGENKTADGIELDMCADFNTIIYEAEKAENMHALFEYKSYAEVAPGHWRIDAANVYEGSRIPLTIDLYVDGDTMREVSTSEGGRQQEAELVRCD